MNRKQPHTKKNSTGFGSGTTSTHQHLNTRTPQDIRIIFSLLACLVFTVCRGQEYTASSVFAHNDYVRAVPFYTAYALQVGFIEADVFLHEGDLLVAHHEHEIEKGKNLETLYLKPLLNEIKKNKGFIYADQGLRLTLMIDLKTEGMPTLDKLVEQLNKYPELTSCSTLQFMISGSVPDPKQWNNYPGFIYFDGRPHIPYTRDQLKRISMISTNFRDHAQWDGTGVLHDSDLKKIMSLIDEVHARGKAIRFWATPDFRDAWQELMRLKMDVIVTDDVAGLAAFIKQQEEQK
jgi:alkaline phosphatase